jgi:Putative peptidoglycan binding domain
MLVPVLVGLAALGTWMLWPRKTVGSSAPFIAPPTGGGTPHPGGVGDNYAPAPVILRSTDGTLNLAPTVITPTGAASLSVSTVGDVQNALNTLGYATPVLTVDQKAGPLTMAAIKKFQAKVGLPVNGVIDQPLKDALVNALDQLGQSA